MLTLVASSSKPACIEHKLKRPVQASFGHSLCDPRMSSHSLAFIYADITLMQIPETWPPCQASVAI